jgi:hypothetical protein
VEELRKRWRLLVVAFALAILLGYPPALPGINLEITVITDKETYLRGEPIIASAYILNDNPFPVRYQKYQTMTAELYNLGDTAGIVAHLDWPIYGSVYIPAHSKYILFENTTFHSKDVGIGSLSVNIHSGGNLMGRGSVPIIVMMDESNLSETGKSAVDAALRYALIQQEIPDYRILAEKTPIVLSSMCLGDYQPNIPEVELQILTIYEIQQKANRDGDFLYLNFKYIRVHSSGHVSVSLDNNWIRAKDSTKGYLSGGGFTLDMYKNEDAWEIYRSAGWIS